MRLVLFTLICIGLSACAGPQIVTHHVLPDKSLHMNSVSQIQDVTEIEHHMFYLNKGDVVPLKLKMETSLLEFKETQVHLVLKRKLFFRLEISDQVSREDLEEVLAMAADELAAMPTKELLELAAEFRFFISQDGVTWALLTDMDGVKEVLGLERGSFSLGMAFSGEEGMWLLLSLNIEDRPRT